MKLHTTATAIALGLFATSAQAADDAAMKALAQKSGCLACHSIDKKLVGPSYKDVAAKYAGDTSAPAVLLQKIKKGGKGVWGPVPMPPNVTVKDADAKALITWVLAQK